MNANTSLLSTASQPAVLAVSVAPTRPSVRYTLSQLHPSEAEIDRCRLDIQMRMPQVAIGALLQFLHNLFAEDDLVKAFESRADKDDPMQAHFLNMLAESRKNPIMRSAPAKGK